MKLIISADVVPTNKSEQLFIDGNIEVLFAADMQTFLQTADRAIINLECALTGSDNRINKIGPNLKASPRCVNAFKKIGVTDCALSNNHIYDFGTEGLRETLETLSKVRIGYMGVGENDEDCRKPYLIEEKGKKIAIINVCEHEYSYALPDRIGANPFDPFLTMRDIRNAKEKADCVIVLYHGGKELCQYPSPRLMALCREMVECGADVVLTQHSHCIGCYELYKNGHILYGQGNFHFAKDNATSIWYTGLLTEVTVKEDIQVKFYPTELNACQVSLAKGDRYTEIMNAFYERCEELKTGEWRKGWHEFCVKNQNRYIKTLEGFGCGDEEKDRKSYEQTFAHLLDCEAHTDVWRELFPTWNWTNEK